MQDIIYFINQLNLDNMTIYGDKVNARCNICGDSRKSLSKRRAWILINENSATYYCHNCGIKLSFENYLKEIGELRLYDEFVNSRKQSYIKSRENTKVKKKEKSTIKINKIKYRKLSKKKFKSIKDFPKHIEYMKNRKVPDDLIKNCMVYTGDKWYNDYIVIPFLNGDKLYGFQARSIAEKKFYISKLNDITIWNYFNVDNEDVVYILEGFFDAMHVRNSIAILGAGKNSDYVKKIKRKVYVFDCDEKGYQEAIKRVSEGEKVCLLWKYLGKYKDINNYICSTGDEDIMTKILNNTFSGLDAQMELFKIKREYGYRDELKQEVKDYRRLDIDNILKRN